MPNGEARKAELIAEYKEVNANFRMLADIRFKLLALMPTLGGVAIYLLSRLQNEPSEAPLGYGLLLLISGLGFLATLGVMFYDQRNSELYNALIERARYLEGGMNLPADPVVKKHPRPPGGQFNERPPRGRRMLGLISLGHDTGLALIYGVVLGAWFFLLSPRFWGFIGCFPEARNQISLAVALLMSVVFIVDLLRLDGTFRRRALGDAQSST